MLVNGKRIATFEPQGGGPWARVIGEERWFACTARLAPILDWPFQQGRTPFTLLGIVLVGICGIWLAACRQLETPVARGPRLVLRRPLLWRQGVTGIIITALLLATTPANVEAQTYTPVFYYYHSDHLGSSNVLTDRSGTRVQHYQYGAFSAETYKESTQAVPMSNRFTDQIFDEDTGLYYFNARYYDPELGRFTQADIIVPGAFNPQNLNRYSYCGNNPLKYVDPTGHAYDLIVGTVVSAAIGAAVGAVVAAATGGNVAEGAYTGAISGAMVYLGSYGGPIGATAAGAAAGAINAHLTEGKPGLGALIGGMGAANGYMAGQVGLPDTWVGDLLGFALAAGTGALSGGIAAELYGGEFAEGAAQGAIAGAIGYAVTTDLPSSMSNAMSDNPRFHLFLDTVWDVANVIYDVYHGLRTGDWTDLGPDVVSAAIPGLPAGTSKLRHLGKVAKATKAVNLPGWEKVTVDMAHIAERHMNGGALTAGRDVFVGLNERGVMAAIKQAYGSATTVTVQGERVLLRGTTKTGTTVEMWFNKTTRQIESAWPQTGRTMGR